jgi:hypothetical protein
MLKMEHSRKSAKEKEKTFHGSDTPKPERVEPRVG